MTGHGRHQLVVPVADLLRRPGSARDEHREAFLQRLHAMGVALRIYVAREGPTRRSAAAAESVFGPITVLTPDEVEHRIQAEEAVR